MYTPDEYLDKDIADKVTAEWKVIYKETSARDPEAVTDVFKSVMGVFDEVGVRQYEDDDRGHHDNERLKPCVILWLSSYKKWKKRNHNVWFFYRHLKEIRRTTILGGFSIEIETQIS